MFEEITANNLLKVDFDGNVITGDYPYNNAGHAIHTAILRGRPDVNVALHSHTRAGIAVSCLEEGLLPLSQQAEVAYKVQVDVMAAGAKRRMPNKEALASIGRFSVMPKDGPAPYVGIT